MNLVHKLSLVVIVLIAAWFGGCGFSKRMPWFDPCRDIESGPATPANMPPPVTVFGDLLGPAGSIIVMEGMTTATVTGTSVRVDQTVNLPEYANEATVFLNGWQVAYNDTDHHLYDVAALIGRIRVTPGEKITWTATGDLADSDPTEPYTWTYRYTVIGWNNTAIRAMVDHNDGEFFCRTGQPQGEDNFFQAENTETPESTTALSSFASFLRNSRFSEGRQVAMLARGFVFSWTGTSGGDDHHLLQLGYNLESAAPFARDQPYHKATKLFNPLPGGAAHVANGEFASWKTSVVFKDNSRRHDYSFVEFVSGMGGADVEIIQPEFVILPREDVDANIVGGGPSGGLKSLDVVIPNLPYAYAVPILTGWEIGYTPPGEGDQHVKELGIWIDQISYQPAGAAKGTLRYRVSSILKDKDSSPGNFFRHKVTILGLKPSGGGVILDTAR